MMSSLVLTGFMACGKTSVGREVAARLGWRFVDMDAEIEARSAKNVAAIFAEDGEPAFRQLEHQLLQELAPQREVVIATGGGALLDERNRRLLDDRHVVVCLWAGIDQILERAAGDPAGQVRPLLAVDDPRARVEQLLAERRDVYRSLPWQVDTDGRSVAQVVDRVATLAKLWRRQVQAGEDSYPIYLGSGLIDELGQVLCAKGAAPASRVAVISNDVVAPLYAERARAALTGSGLRSSLCVLPDGEKHKTLESVARVYEFLLDQRLDRRDTVLALGGGVVGDMAGFAAATYMRGVRFVGVPTTLLAMVDASVGGKTGVDLPRGKNLVGAFKQPAAVCADPSVLQTLAPEELRGAVAEVIKHGVIGAPALFGELEAAAGQLELWTGVQGCSWIATAIEVKVAVVEQDPLEKGCRAGLNLGHTVGHALEQLSGFALSHGMAVSVGLVAAARIAARLGRMPSDDADRIEALLDAWGLPVRCPPHRAEEVISAMAHDKKKQGRSLRWALPQRVGHVELYDDVVMDDVAAVLRHLGAQ